MIKKSRIGYVWLMTAVAVSTVCVFILSVLMPKNFYAHTFEGMLFGALFSIVIIGLAIMTVALLIRLLFSTQRWAKSFWPVAVMVVIASVAICCVSEILLQNLYSKYLSAAENTDTGESIPDSELTERVHTVFVHLFQEYPRTEDQKTDAVVLKELTATHQGDTVQLQCGDSEDPITTDITWTLLYKGPQGLRDMELSQFLAQCRIL